MPTTMPKPLHERIRYSARLAKASPGTDIHLALKGGLHIWIKYLPSDRGGDYSLRIGRQRVKPSRDEWRTVLNSWMWPVQRPPLETTDGATSILSALIPDRKMQQLELI